MAYLGRSPAIGSQKVLDSIESQFNGSLTTFNLRYNNQPIYPALPASLIVSLGGVLQEPREAYTVVSDTIVFASAPPAASDCWILLYSEYGAFVGGATSGDFTVSGDLTLASELHGPANLIIDPAAVGDDTGTVEIKGNLTVQGTTTTINSTTVDLDHLSLGDGEIANFGTDNDLRIYHSGNISRIYDTSTNLQIAGSIIEFRNSGTNEVMIAAYEDDRVELYYDGLEKLETTSTGVTITGNLIADNVGIGTSSPSYVLDVQDSGAEAVLQLNRTDAATAGVLLVGSGDAANFITSGGTKDLFIATDNTERMRVDADGNVGIGTNSPIDLLSVGSSTTADQRISLFSNATSDNESYGSILFRFNTANGNKNAKISALRKTNSSGADLVFYTRTPGDAVNNDGGEERMRITSSGSVGIGETNPIYKLHLGDGAAEEITAKLTDGADSNFILAAANGSAINSAGNEVSRFGIYYEGTTNDWNSYLQFIRGTGATTGEIAFITSQSEALRIDGSGNVGIGTDSPSSLLHVSVDSAVNVFRIARTDAPASIQSIFGNGDAAFKYTVNNAGSWLQGIDDSDADKFKISYGSAADAAFGTNDYLTVDALGIVTAERLRLTATGDASVSSTNHALQIGSTGGSNVIFDNNEIMARNNGAVATLNLNPDGGAVQIHNNTTAGTFTIGGNTIWHAGNMGDGSTLDADLLDGIEASGFMQTASQSTSSSMKIFYTDMSSQEDYTNSPISIRERGQAGAGDGEDRDAPNINFHWGSRASNSLWMNSTGQLNYGNYSSTGIPAVDGRINAGSFQGPINSDSGDVFCNNNAFIASDPTGGAFGDRTGSNIDHFWHDDNAVYGTPGSWVFNSDTTYRNNTGGFSNIKAGHVYVDNGDLGTTAGDIQDLARFYANNGNATSIRLQAKRKLAGTSWESASMKIFCYTDSTEQGYIEFNPHTTTVADGNNHIAFGSGGFEYARFTNNGEFGIGTTSPAANLQVEYSLGSNAPSTIRIGTTDNLDIDRIYSIGWGNPSVTQMGIGPYSSTRGIFNPLAPRHGLAIHVHEDDEFSVRSTGWDKLFGIEGGTGRAYHLGNVGFGTVDPQCTIDMTGHIEIEGSAIGGILTSSVAVDNYVEVTPPILGGQLFITSFATYDNFPQPTGSGQIYYDVGSSPLITVLVDVDQVRNGTNSLDASLDTSTTATNFAANVTTVVALSTGVLRIWNRMGGSRLFKLVFV